MGELAIEAGVIVGHSGGGYIAQGVAVDHPDRTLGAVLVGAPRAFDDNPAVAELGEEVRRLTDPVDPAFVRAFQESCLAEPVPAAFLEAVIAEGGKLVWRSYLDGRLSADVPTEAGTIAAPTLILWGDRDAFITRGDQEALRDAIPGAELVVYEGTGHCPHWERPERAAADLASFAAHVESAEPVPSVP